MFAFAYVLLFKCFCLTLKSLSGPDRSPWQ